MAKDVHISDRVTITKDGKSTSRPFLFFTRRSWLVERFIVHDDLIVEAHWYTGHVITFPCIDIKILWKYVNHKRFQGTPIDWFGKHLVSTNRRRNTMPNRYVCIDTK